MKISSKNNNLILTDVADFKLEHIFDCGQCFRWEKEPDGSYIGVACKRALKIAKENDSVILYDSTREDFDKIWFNYLDLVQTIQV